MPTRIGLTLITILSFSTFGILELQAEPPSDKYQLVWADEFEGTELDAKKWAHRDLGPRRDAINVKEAVTLDGEGHLLITTTKVGDEYHTGMICTRDLFEPTFGYFETRVKFQDQVGHWSAFWIHSPTISKIGNPQRYGTEIDIYEYLVKDGDLYHINLHWDGYGEHHKTTGSKHEEEGLSEGFHVIGLEWTPEEYVFYCDGKEVWRTKEAVSHRSEYIILSMEVGEWAGDIKEATLPDSVVFDYIRAYQIPSSKDQ